VGSVGFPEVIVILFVALIVLGPDKLPTAAKQVGRAFAEFKKVTSQVQDEVRGALTVDQSAPPLPPTGSEPTASPRTASPVQPGNDVPPPHD
jgi:Tat protein translocase TatB subunit